jgi:spore maturation protein CgeB
MTRRLVVFGLSLSSSWGNGHAPTFRGLLRALSARDWQITFFERDVEWYASNRDLAHPEFCDLQLYTDWVSAIPRAEAAVRDADAVLVGSLVSDGQAILDWLVSFDRLRLFYDIDTPVTLVELRRARCTRYLRADQIPLVNVYFSFAGGPALTELEATWGAPIATALYCGVDTLVYRPVAPDDERFQCALGYMGTYTADRQSAVEDLLIAPARARPNERFILAGPQYPLMSLPPNVIHEQHLYPRDHAAFYCSSRATLNLTRQAMRDYGWAPSTRLFEAAACGACIISDTWPGLDRLFEPCTEILLAENGRDVLLHLDTLSPRRRQQIGLAARTRVMREHTYERRAEQFEHAVEQSLAGGVRTTAGRQWANGY